jgi:hypothetical protein
VEEAATGDATAGVFHHALHTWDSDLEHVGSRASEPLANIQTKPADEPSAHFWADEPVYRIRDTRPESPSNQMSVNGDRDGRARALQIANRRAASPAVETAVIPLTAYLFAGRIKFGALVARSHQLRHGSNGHRGAETCKSLILLEA